MVTTQEVFTVAQSLAGRTLSEEEKGTLAMLCEVSRQKWENQLREDIDETTCHAELCTAAAWSALGYLGSAWNAGQPALSFTTGDLSIRTGETTSLSKSLAKQAEEMMAPFVKDSGFAVLEVEG